MQHHVPAYYDFFGRPLGWQVRMVLVLAILVLPLAWRAGPLWTMSFQSNQYPDPLRMSIYIDHLEGQKSAERDDLREINSLNHYIGMRPLLESDFAEFLWLPFVVGIFGLLCLRLVVLGRLRDVVDVFVLYIYFGLFSLWDFYFKLYSYGHNLDPEAAIKVDPFTPPLFGKVKIANFWVESLPGGASFALAAFGVLLALATLLALWQTWRDHRQALRDELAGLVAVASWLLVLVGVPTATLAAEHAAPSEHSDLARRIAAAQPGCVVQLEPGTYRGNLVIDKALTLRGGGAARIVGDSDGQVIRIEAADVTLDGLHVSGSGSNMMHSHAGIEIRADRATVRNCTLRDNLFGIYLRGANDVLLEGNSITGRQDKPLGSRGAGIHLYDSDRNVVRDNRLEHVRDGVYFDHADDNLVEGNSFARLRYGVHYMYCAANEFYRNTFRDSVAGAAIMYTDGVRFSDNLILNNRQGHNAFGLLFQACSDCVAERNIIINNTCGFFLEGARRNVLRNNLVAYNDSAAVIYGSSSENVFESNDFIGNIATLRAVGKPEASWGGSAAGNYYSAYRGYDLDADGRGDVPFPLQDAFQFLTGNHPLLQLYLSSAACDALVLAERSFPVLPYSDAEEKAPAMRPVSGVHLALPPGDTARPKGSTLLAALLLIAWGGCLGLVRGLAR
jgi:nitrous oxidase accessory protein